MKFFHRLTTISLLQITAVLVVVFFGLHANFVEAKNTGKGKAEKYSFKNLKANIVQAADININLPILQTQVTLPVTEPEQDKNQERSPEPKTSKQPSQTTEQTESLLQMPETSETEQPEKEQPVEESVTTPAPLPAQAQHPSAAKTTAPKVAFNFTLPAPTSVQIAQNAASPENAFQVPLVSFWQPVMSKSPYLFYPLSRRTTILWQLIAAASLALGSILLFGKPAETVPRRGMFESPGTHILHPT